MSTPEALSEGSRVSMVPDSQLTTENLSLEVRGLSFGYRRFGNEQTPAPPLVTLQHFRGRAPS